jgi:hypothetical protein
MAVSLKAQVIVPDVASDARSLPELVNIAGRLTQSTHAREG